VRKAYTLKKDILPFQKDLPNVSLSKLLDEYLDFTDAKLILFDLETLGLNPNFEYEQITEISAWVVDGNNMEVIETLNCGIKLNESAQTLIDDATSIERINWVARQKKRRGNSFDSPTEILDMTHYYDLNTETNIKEYEGVSKFIDLINKYENVITVAHNAKFDVKFMTIRSSKYEKKFPITNTLDTLKLSRYFFSPLVLKLATHNDVKEIYNSLFRPHTDFIHISSKLGELANALSIDSSSWHSADADVGMMYEILKFMMNFFETHKDEDIQTYQKQILKRNIGKNKPK
jgi:DNA polymerase III epsilon subunit-like protein